MTDQLDRIEAKLTAALEMRAKVDATHAQVVTNTADISWLKRYLGALAGLCTAISSYFWRRHGGGGP